MNRARRFLAAMLAPGIAALLLTGCTPPPEEDHYAIAVGSHKDFAGLELRSIFIVTSAENEPGRILGTVFNKTDENVNLVIGDRDDELPLSIPAGGKVEFQDSPTVLNSTEARPGARTDLTVKVRGDTTSFDVAVLDGTLEQYAPYVPEEGLILRPGRHLGRLPVRHCGRGRHAEKRFYSPGTARTFPNGLSLAPWARPQFSPSKRKPLMRHHFGGSYWSGGDFSRLISTAESPPLLNSQ